MADTAVAPVSDAPASTGVDAAPGEYDFDDEGYQTPFDATPAATPPAEEKPPEAVPEPAAGATPAVPSAIPPAPAVSLTPEQIARANAVGLTQDQLLALGNPELAIVTAENVAMKAAWQTQQAQQRAAQQQAAPAPPQPPQKPQLLDVEAVKKQYKDDGYEDNLIEVFARDAERHNQHLQKQYDLDQRLYEMQVKDSQRDQWSADAYLRIQHLANQQNVQQVKHTEELIHRDYEAWKNQASPEMKKLLEQPGANQRVFQSANIIFTGQLHNGIPLTPNPEVFDLAAQMAFGKELKSMIREEVRAEVKEAQGRAISRPSSGGKPQRTGSPTDRAVAVAEDFYRKLGLGSSGAIHSTQDL